MAPSSMSTFFLLTLHSLLVSGSPMDQIFNKRQISCPKVHIFGARETTAPVGFGSSSTVVDAVKAAHSGATSEAIKYPACGGQSQCGGVQYAASASQGATAVVSAINDFHKQCPDTQIVLVGYSQGGQIMDDALCGGKLTGTALDAIKAAIFMGDPMFVAGLDYEVGTCKTQGFAARTKGFKCPAASKIQSYCDSPDPFCCNGNDQATHQGYGKKYGQDALKFVNGKLSGGGDTTTPTTPTTSNTPTGTSKPGSGSTEAPSNTPSSTPSMVPSPGPGDGNTGGTGTGGTGTGNGNGKGGNGGNGIGKPGNGAGQGGGKGQNPTNGGPSKGTGKGQGNGACAAKYQQCGGQTFTGSTCCQSGSTCKKMNTYYSQCQ